MLNFEYRDKKRNLKLDRETMYRVAREFFILTNMERLRCADGWINTTFGEDDKEPISYDELRKIAEKFDYRYGMVEMSTEDMAAALEDYEKGVI